MKFTVQQKSTKIEVAANVDIGETLAEAVEICGGGEAGAAIVLGKYKAAVATAIRARMDTLLNTTNAGKCLSPAQTIEKMEHSYKITMGKQRRSDLEKAQAAFDVLSTEDKESALAFLKGQDEADAA